MNLAARNYRLLLASQFLGAFGDNAILAVIVGQLTRMQLEGTISSDELRTRSAVYTSLLFIPYVLLAPLAGYLNDRYSKTSWLLGGNVVKLTGTAICGLSVWCGYHWQALGYLVVGIGSTVYGPAKYGILPEILPRERLVKANGMLELLTLVAILTGAIGGAVIVDLLPVSICYAILLGIFAASTGLNWLMTHTPSDPTVHWRNSVTEFFQHLLSMLAGSKAAHLLESNSLAGPHPASSWKAWIGLVLRGVGNGPRLGKILIGTALFWICGAAMKINFQPWGLDVLKLPDNTQIALLGLWLSVGVMIGSILAGVYYRVGDLSHTRWFGYLLAGVLGFVFLVGPLGLADVGRYVFENAQPDGSQTVALVFMPAVMAVLVGAGITAGLFLIPLNAALQAESDPLKLGKTIAVQNLGDNTGMILAGLLVLGCTKMGLSASQVFLVLAAVVIVVVSWLRIPRKEA